MRGNSLSHIRWGHLFNVGKMASKLPICPSCMEKITANNFNTNDTCDTCVAWDTSKLVSEDGKKNQIPFCD